MPLQKALTVVFLALCVGPDSWAPPPTPSAPTVELMGNHPELTHIRERLARVAPSEASVLIVGETGTGKDILARKIHEQSERAKKPFVEVNVAQLSSSLWEDELFGHKRGAFSGAESDRAGLLEKANGGTLYLSGLADMPKHIQASLLRFLQERKIRRLGSNEEIPINVRIIASSNRNPKELVKEGVIREDLYHRLNTFEFNMPPFKELKGDFAAFYREIVRREKLQLPPEPSEQVLESLKEHSWPGNVREFTSVLTRADIQLKAKMVSSVEEAIAQEMEIAREAEKRQVEKVSDAQAAKNAAERASMERELIEFACNQLLGTMGEENRGKLARKLGVTAEKLKSLERAARALQPTK